MSGHLSGHHVLTKLVDYPVSLPGHQGLTGFYELFLR